MPRSGPPRIGLRPRGGDPSPDERGDTTQNAYNQLSELTQKTLPVTTLTETRNYDYAGNLASLVHFDGTTTTYTYDALNRLTGRSSNSPHAEPPVSFAYTPTGKYLTSTAQDGTVNYTYDALDRLITKATPEGTLTYHYYSTGKVESIQSSNTNGANVSYTMTPSGSSSGYDSLNRLVSANITWPDSTQQIACFTYDAFGNRTMEALSTIACNSNPTPTAWAQFNGTTNGTNNNQMSATSQNLLQGATGGYDLSGNILNDGINQYAYDGEGRICAVLNNAVPGWPTMTGYLYDADGNRVAKGTISTMCCDPTTNGFQFTENYVLGPGGEELTMLNGSNAWQRTNVYAAGKLLATYDLASNELGVQSAALHFHVEDPLGTRRMQLGGNLAYNGQPATLGCPETDIQSLPFGDQLNSFPDQYACATADDATPLHFTGKERDSESGNDYFGARYYASSMGRFMSPDSPGFAHLSNPQAWNLYAYTHNNPLSSVDPDGHDVACGTGSVGQCLADANNSTGAGGRVYAIQTTTDHSFLGLFHYSTTETTLAIHGDEATFRALGPNASKLADLIDNHSFTLTVNYGSFSPTGGSISFMKSQGYKDPSVLIDPTRPGGNYDSDATEDGIPQASTAEEFGHEVLGHQWGELINGDKNADGLNWAPTTRANMRDSITGENAVRALDPTAHRGQKGIFDHHSYSDAPSDGYKK